MGHGDFVRSEKADYGPTRGALRQLSGPPGVPQPAMARSGPSGIVGRNVGDRTAGAAAAATGGVGGSVARPVILHGLAQRWIFSPSLTTPAFRSEAYGPSLSSMMRLRRSTASSSPAMRSSGVMAVTVLA